MAVKSSGRPFKKGQSGNPRGRPKGAKSKTTIAKEMEEEELRSLIRKDLHQMLDAQIANAKGIKFLMVRERKGGKFKRVVETMAKAAAGGKVGKDEEIIEVWEKDPSVHAWDSLLNRAYGQARKPPEDVNVSGDWTFHWKTNE
ncbi:MAG: DUF5681 domain-containing protein [Dehalococcoidia bacterium]